MEEGGRIRCDLLGKAVQAAGVDGGMSRNTKIASAMVVSGVRTLIATAISRGGLLAITAWV